MKFTHLHVHSHYSLLDGLPKIDEILDYAKELGMDSIALTDHGVLYGAVEFYKKAKEHGIKPIIGAELYLAFERMTQERPNIDDERYHLVVLVKNEEGYKNLVKLLTKAHLKGFYYKPRVDEELLAKHSKGLIALSACLSGKIPKMILAKKMDGAEKTALLYQEIFGKDNFYLEIQYHPHSHDQKIVNRGLISISRKLGIPLVATNDVHYLKPEDAEAQDILMLISTGADPNDPERLTLKEDDFSLRSPEKMLADFKDLPEAIENTQKIAESCNFQFDLGKIKLPQYEVPSGKSPDQYLEELCSQGVKKRYSDKPPKEVLDRVNYELGVIKQTGFASYFLIVQDFVNWAKENRIVVGPGRGSVAGSLVAYLLNITNVDPLKYNLLFERFLTSERVSLPDIDLDFTDRRRDEVIDYVTQKYGRDKVAQIITFGTMAARAVVRDVGRALGYSYSFCDQIAKMIPFGLTLDQTLARVSEFRQLYLNDEKAHKLVDFAKKLEGCARHASTHACGVVISSQSLDEIIPLQHPTQDEENIVTQYEMHSVEDLGLLKMDFLGLKNLTIIEDTLSRIYKVQGKKIDIENIPLDDKATYKLLQKGDCVGLFQLESEGMRRYLKQLKPGEFEDIIAMVALYRPGPMQFIPDYIDGKRQKKRVEYLHPKLKQILEPTYGICVTGDSLVQTANPGTILSIKEIINSPEHFKVQTFDGKQFKKGEIISKFDNGIKDIYKIILRTGKQIRATEDHQFLTPDGWRKVKGLKVGDFLATPKKLFSGTKKFDKNKLKVLAYLIADGALTSGGSCYFVNKNPLLLKDFKRCAESSFKNLKITFTKHIRKVKRANPSKINSSGSLYHQSNTLLKWLRELKLKSQYGGKSSAEKFIPSFLFELDEECIATFLATLWDCDGGIVKKMAYLTTISERLAYDIQTLLLKLGVNSYIYEQEKYKSRKGKTMQAYRVCIYDLESFTTKIGCLMLTNKKRVLENTEYGLNCKEFVSRRPFLKKLNNYLKTACLSKRAFCKLYKFNRSNLFGKNSKNRSRLNLQVASKMADFFQDKNLKKISNDKNIRWEDIISINYTGREHVYDIEVKGSHNFIVNNILSHNCVYQEQIMQIAQVLAGFSLSEADILRKAIGKKIRKLLMSQKEKFIEGCKKNEIDENISQRIWNWIEPFARYSFNKSHATCYATIAYQTAYLKAHFPVEFMASLLTSEKADVERIGFLIAECKKMGVEVLAPDINESLENFTVVAVNKIRFGLLAIKNAGTNVAEVIVRERKNSGPYHSIADFISRVDSAVLNKKSLESLIRAGVFDKLAERNQLLFNLESLLEWSRETQRQRDIGQRGLFDNLAIESPIFKSDFKLAPAEPASKTERLNWEKELLGLYVSSHPLQDFQRILEKKAMAISKISATLINRQVKIGGIISKIKKIITRTGKPMLFMNLEDLNNKIEVVVFPGAIERNPSAFQENKIVLVSGRVDMRDGIPKIICEQIEEITET